MEMTIQLKTLKRKKIRLGFKIKTRQQQFFFNYCFYIYMAYNFINDL